MRIRELLAAYALFIVYGSLVPLDFQPLPLAAAWNKFQNIPFLNLGVESRADWIANGVLYFPLGVLGWLYLHQSRPAWRGAGFLVFLGCSLLAFCVEFTQIFFPPRSVTQNDLLAETIGSALGVMFAPPIGGWLQFGSESFRRNTQRFIDFGLASYALLYIALCFFPYDLLLSTSELTTKLGSNGWGWLLAHEERGRLFAWLMLAVEACAVVPLGLLWARRGTAVRHKIRSATVLGIVFGCLIEIGQFFLASGVSQGASVVSRAVGMGVGAWIYPRLQTLGVAGVKREIRRAARWIALPWLVLLLAVNGWLRGTWHGFSAAMQVWQELHLLPFYYHYFTTEAAALFSLLTVALSYLPIGIVIWSRNGNPANAAVWASVLALPIEAGKLFISGRHPDPTNILIAATSAGVTVMALRALFKSDVQPTATVATIVSPGPPSPPLPTWIAALPALAWAWTMPGIGPALAIGLACCALIVVLRPASVLAILPAAMVMLDFAPWTGRLYVDEFDLAVIVTLAIATFRTHDVSSLMLRPASLRLGAILLTASLTASVLMAVVPWQPLNPNSFASFISPLSAIRIAKGALWAAWFLLIFDRLAAKGVAAEPNFRFGMLVALAFVCGWVVWERAAFASVWDFETNFRVSGPFAAMHRGGAYIECFIAVGSAFATWALLSARGLMQRAMAASLLAVSIYAMMVTFARNGWIAMTVAILGSCAARLFIRKQGRQRWIFIAMTVVMLVATAMPVLVGGFAQQRFSRTGIDLMTRVQHWRDALAIRHSGGLWAVFGEGLGSFPEAHYWRSKETTHAASYRLDREANGPYLRLGSGAILYIEQILTISPPPDGSWTVEANLRTSHAEPRLRVALCRKWLLTSRDCVHAELIGTDATGWQRVRAEVSPPPPLAQAFAPPLVFALLTPEGTRSLDVAHVRLSNTLGEVLKNGDFESGLDRWYFTTDVDPPWHIHNLPVAVLFEQGWFGMMAWTVVTCLALIGGLAAMKTGRTDTVTATVAALAFLACGMLNTLLDQPRFLWLLLVLLGMASAPASNRKPG